jgi:hypothetical protein
MSLVLLFNTPGVVPPEYIGSTTTDNATNNVNLTLNVPSGTQDGDQMLLFAVSSSGTALNGPAGWNVQETSLYQNSAVRVSLFSRTASSEPPSYTWAHGGSAANTIVASMAVWRGVTIRDSPALTGASSTTTYTPGTPAGIQATDWLVQFAGTRPDGASQHGINNPSGFTSRASISGTGSTFPSTLRISEKTGNTTGAFTATTGTNQNWGGGSIALIPNVVPSTPITGSESTALSVSDTASIKVLVGSPPSTVHGMYRGWDAGNPLTTGAMDTYQSTYGVTVKYGHEFGDNAQWSYFANGTNFSNWNAWVGAVSGRRMTYSCPLLAAPNAGDYAGLNAGTYDAHFTSLGQAIQAQPNLRNMIIRLGWEFNGSTFPWALPNNATNQNLTDYKNAYNRAASLIKAQAPGVQFEWCPNLHLDNANRTFADMYPGNTYVDYIGAAVYDYYWPGGTPTEQQRYDWIVNDTNGLADQVALAQAQGKPVAYTEWGLWQTSTISGGGDRPAFISMMLNWMAQYNAAYSIYNNVSANGIHTLSNYPNAHAVYIARFKNGELDMLLGGRDGGSIAVSDTAAKAHSRTITDSSGTTDSGAVVGERAVGNDNSGVTDSLSSQKAASGEYATLNDNSGTTDAGAQVGAKISSTDNSGVNDSISTQKFSNTRTFTDNSGSSDNGIQITAEHIETFTDSAGSTDNRITATSRAASDSISLAVSDSATLFKTITASDTAALTITESSSASQNAAVPGAETIGLGVTEQATILVTQSRTDTASLAVSESASTAVSLSRTDTAAISVSDVSTHNISLSRADTASLTITESTSGFNTAVASDTASISVNDVGAFAPVGMPGADGGALAVTEQATIVVSITASDTASLTITEASTHASTLSRTDTAALTITESTSHALSLSRTDTAALSVSDTSSHLITLSRTDAAALTISDASTHFITKTASDTAALTITEISNTGGDQAVPGSETIALGVTEQANIFVTTSASDTMSLSVADAHSGAGALARTDTASLAVTETPEKRTNLVKNPTFKNSTPLAHWNVLNSGTVNVTNGVARLTATTNGQGIRTQQAIGGMVVTPSTVYTLSVDADMISGTNPINLRFEWWTAAGGFIQSNVSPDYTTDGRLVYTTTSPSNAYLGNIAIVTSYPSNNAVWDLSNILVVEGTSTQYFDGDSVGSTWSGTAHGSLSTHTASGYILASLSASDTAAIAVADVATLTKNISASDTMSLSVSESTSGFYTKTASDTAALSITENSSAGGNSNIPGSETIGLGVVEQATIFVTQSRTDTTAISVSDISTHQSTLSRTDGAAISVSDTSSHLISLSRTDTAALTITEARTTFVTLSRTDTASLAVSDAAGVVRPISATDTLTIGLTESATAGELGAVVKVYINGDYVMGTIYVRVGSIWKEARIRVYRSGVWT